MASRLETISASPMLKQYAQGAAQDSVQPVAEFLAPTVPVATSVGRYKQYDEKHRFHIPQTIRGMGGRAVELSFTMQDKTYNCTPHALDFPVDNLEQLEGDLLENILQEGATLIAEVAGLAHEKSVVDAALAAVGAGTNSNWAASSGVDPVDTIDGYILQIIKAAKYGSLMGVGVLFGASAFRLFKNNPLVRSRFVTAGGNAIPNITPDTSSALLIGSPDTRVSYMVYDSAAEGVAPSMNFILDNSVLIFARKENPTRRDPSFMKTFRLINNFMVPGSYVRDDKRVECATFDWSEEIAVTNSAVAVRLNATTS